MPQIFDDPTSRWAMLVNEAWYARDPEALRALIGEADTLYDASVSSLAKASIAFSRSIAQLQTLAQK